ncbi:hypothetical protein [Massilia violaceinigra]|uniref:hypothetical protein n=1 Tax=Massilia violaceinigra TaxID=2045208 RepID=UPI0012FD592E|nr:hypothetical protein [Massilia violaceinigra]
MHGQHVAWVNAKSDRQRRRTIAVACVETALALGAKQMGNAHGALAQDQLEVRMTAIGTGFPNRTEGDQFDRDIAGVEVVDNSAGIEFTKDELVVGTMALAAAGVCLLIKWF